MPPHRSHRARPRALRHPDSIERAPQGHGQERVAQSISSRHPPHRRCRFAYSGAHNSIGVIHRRVRSCRRAESLANCLHHNTTNIVADTVTRMLKAHVSELLQALPGPRSAKWPDGERFVEAFRHGTLLVELYAPLGTDPQTPHDRDEVYFVVSGSGDFIAAGERASFKTGDALFVAAHVEHRFENFSADFAAWVVFYGPAGGETP